MKNKILAITLLTALSAVPASAYYIGSVGFPMKDGGNALEMVYDTGTREVEGSSGGTDIDMDTDRLYFQYTRGMGNGLEVFGRVMPQTGSAEFEPGGGEFDIWGLGGGVRWSPRQQGRLKLGFQFSFDWNQGDDGPVDLDVKELLFAGGGSYRVNKSVDAYGGLSLLKLDGTLDGPGAGDFDFENSDTFGIFGGFDLKPGRNFTVGVELRLINETLLGVTGRLKF